MQETTEVTQEEPVYITREEVFALIAGQSATLFLAAVGGGILGMLLTLLILALINGGLRF